MMQFHILIKKFYLFFQELEDEIAIRNRAQENLRFAMGEKPIDERKNMSQTKDELILKCSFNQRDCSIEKLVNFQDDYFLPVYSIFSDFKQVFDPTYGNCYTFNWDRSANVTAHRAGANYGKLKESKSFFLKCIFFRP
jgi:hypothetical protein